jgi:hypothetical protein
MQAAGTVFHLLGALRRAIGRVFLWFFLVLVVAVAAVEIVGYVVAGHPAPAQYHPVVLTHVAAAVVGLSLAYAAALTVLVGEVVRFVITETRTAEREVKSELSGGAHVVESVVKTLENREHHQ